jgi:hypothetical protein
MFIAGFCLRYGIVLESGGLVDPRTTGCKAVVKNCDCEVYRVHPLPFAITFNEESLQDQPMGTVRGANSGKYCNDAADLRYGIVLESGGLVDPRTTGCKAVVKNCDCESRNRRCYNDCISGKFMPIIGGKR